MVEQAAVTGEAEGSSPSPTASTLVVDEPATQPQPNRGGRPRTRQRRKNLVAQVRAGHGVDRAWLIEQLLYLYNAKGIRPNDKLRAIELMARISGYSGKDVEPEDEKRAIADLMRDMENAST